MPLARRRNSTYRHRKPWPAVVILVVLVTAGVGVWTTVFRRASDTNAQVGCPGPAATEPAGWTPLPYTALNHVAPIPADQVRVRTLNGATERGLAVRISLELGQFGFTSVGVGNDPLHPRGDLRCVGQIRFGPTGAAAARTLSLVFPCAQLVRDDRPDDTVDLALGAYATDATPNPAARTALKALAAEPAPSGGGQQSARTGLAPAVPAHDLTAARAVAC